MSGSTNSDSERSKLDRFHKLKDEPYFAEVVAANRAYLSAAVPDALSSAGDRWVLTCLPTPNPDRLSAVSMRNMETFVLYADRDTSPASVLGFVIVRRGAALSGFGSHDAIRSAFDLDEVDESTYYSAGDDQLRLAGAASNLRQALSDPRIAEAARELADFLTTGTTVYARYHNPFLTEEVLQPL